MTLNPYALGKRCDSCCNTCGVDEYTYGSETICAGCLKTLEDEGIAFWCAGCGDVFDADGPMHRDTDEERICEGCHTKGNEDGDAIR